MIVNLRVVFSLHAIIRSYRAIHLTCGFVYVAIGLFVIKKHFGKLCDSLPNNYQKTIKRLKQLTDLAKEDMALILSSTDDELMYPVAVNQRILMHLFMNCQSCDQLMNVSTIIEELADSTKRLSVNNFQRGKNCS